jgi:hypothetical protein
VVGSFSQVPDRPLIQADGTTRATLEGHPVNKFRTWEAGITPVLHGAMAVLNACDRACESHWAPALVAHADQIGAAARSVHEWIEEHQCPYPDLDFLLVGMARSYVYLAGSLMELTTADSPGAWGELERDLRGVHRSVAGVLAAMYRESARQV